MRLGLLTWKHEELFMCHRGAGGWLHRDLKLVEGGCVLAVCHGET